MASRRLAREASRRLRLFSSRLDSAFEETAAVAGRGMPRGGSKGLSPNHWSLLGEESLKGLGSQQQRPGQMWVWILAAGGATAASTLTASAGSWLSTEAEAPPEAPADSASPKPVRRNRVVFVLGGPGSGKGTQCAKIVDEYGFTHLSAGDLLRAEIKSGSEYGTMIQNMIKEGKIVPAEVTVGLLKKAMVESGNDKFLIDGFPRNDENRLVFERDTGISPEFILFFDCPEDVMEKRLLGRNQGRIDDNIETIRKRFKVFVDQSMPVVGYYEKLGKVRKIDATKTPDEVFKSYSNSFIRFIEDDLLEKSKELLAAIDSADYAAYSQLCDSGMTCFEPESQGHLVEGLPFHELYFKPPVKKQSLVQSTISSPKVLLVGDVGVVTYTRLIQSNQGDGVWSTVAVNETRIWHHKKNEKDGPKKWKNIHLHRSLAPIA